ncbi:unnamed protein product [Amoebophrya sp. A120]|nr:unnamed protein product [Amoebophrya sp. A120]|eukprot:GSA120T00010890001.1
MGKQTALFPLDPEKYEFNRVLGSGSYGAVQSWKHLGYGMSFAAKRISNAFDEFLICRRTLREIRLMRHFKHENIIGICDVFTQEAERPDPEKTERNRKLGYSAPKLDLYLFSQLMDHDLDMWIRASYKKQHTVAQDAKKIRSYTHQMLLGLKFLHKGHVIHRDLKPANVFISDKGVLKIGDLGLARSIDLDAKGDPLYPDAEALTEYVVTRWYRAPEIMLLRGCYGPVCDVWAVGCILAEMFSRKVLLPGSGGYDQMLRIMRVTGVYPSTSWLNNTTETPDPYARRSRIDKHSGDEGEKIVNRISGEVLQRYPHILNHRDAGSVDKAFKQMPWQYPGDRPSYNYEVIDLPRDVMDRMGELSGNESTMAKDLCMKMLQYSPDIRMTVDEALAHPYLTTDPVIVQKNGKAEMEVENVKKIDMSYDQQYDNRGMSSKDVPAENRKKLAKQLLEEVEDFRRWQKQQFKLKVEEKKKKQEQLQAAQLQQQQMASAEYDQSNSTADRQRVSRTILATQQGAERRSLVEQVSKGLISNSTKKHISPADQSTATNSANTSAATSMAHSRSNSISMVPADAVMQQQALQYSSAANFGRAWAEHGGSGAGGNHPHPYQLPNNHGGPSSSRPQSASNVDASGMTTTYNGRPALQSTSRAPVVLQQNNYHNGYQQENANYQQAWDPHASSASGQHQMVDHQQDLFSKFHAAANSNLRSRENYYVEKMNRPYSSQQSYGEQDAKAANRAYRYDHQGNRA